MPETDHQNDPQFRKWAREQSQYQNGGEHQTGIPFETWIHEKVYSNHRRLQGENPPQSKLQEVEQIKSEIEAQETFERIFLAVGAFLSLLFGLADGVVATIFTIGAGAYLYYKWPYAKRQQLKKKLPLDDGPIPLDSYNTEFTSPLADRSVLRITVQFQIPAGLTKNVAASSYPYSATSVPSDLVENLNRVTEAKLIIYTHPFDSPPSRVQIEDFLDRELAQFQEEHRISVMRVTVPIAIHVHPDKPKGVNV